MSDEHRLTCECGHADHHEHDHSCEHEGHEHEAHDHPHEHPHDHAHDHQHDHGHDHAHDHGHDHNHSHDHHELKPGELSIQSHEGALVATIQEPLSGSFSDLEAMTGTWLQNIAEKVTLSTGVIGHIKASLAGTSQLSTFSTTDTKAVHVTRSGGAKDDPSDTLAKVELTLVAIVFNVEAEQLRKIVMGSRP